MMDQDQEGCEASIKAFKGETRIIGAGCFDDAAEYASASQGAFGQ